MKLQDLTSMDKMELYLSSLPTSFTDEDNIWQKVFSNSGLYVRSLTINAGEAILGKVHKEWNVNILASGSLYITNDPISGDRVRIDAPYIFETGPGSQKLGFAITDCVFINVIRSNDETEKEVFNRMSEQKTLTGGTKCQE